MSRRENLVCLLLVPLLFVAGCAKKSADKTYGISYGDSINGTKVFFDLLEQRGHEIRRSYSLNPSLMDKADTLVFFQRDPYGLRWDVNRWLQQWLDAGYDRVLVFVGRDFDAAVHFWDDVARSEKSQIAQSKHKVALMELKIQGNARTTSGFSRYAIADSDELSPAAVNAPPDPLSPLAMTTLPDARLYLRHHPAAQTSDAPSLKVQDAPMVVVRKVSTGRVILVANGSFLLNYSLINHDHRLLAVNLAEQLGTRRKVWFIEDGRVTYSGAGFEQLKFRNPLAFLYVPPINWFVIHWLLVGAFFLLHKSPIFGRPRSPEVGELHRFSSHLRAYAELLKRSKDSVYAAALIESYRATVKPRG